MATNDGAFNAEYELSGMAERSQGTFFKFDCAKLMVIGLIAFGTESQSSVAEKFLNCKPYLI